LRQHRPVVAIAAPRCIRNPLMPRPIVVNSKLRIPGDELRLSFARSAGPGGQNVNKVNSKAVLRWKVAASTSLPSDVQARFLEAFASKINQQGELVLDSDRFREQTRNISACYEKLRQMILSVSTPRRPRVKTRPTRGAVERRLQEKQQSSQRKQRRRYRPQDDNDRPG